MPQSKFSNQTIGIAEGRAISLGKAKNRKLSWAMFGKELADPQRTKERQKQFFNLPKEEQDKLKAVNGWILGGEIEGDRRKRASIKQRDLVTFDCDEISPELVEEIKMGVNPICEFEFFAHSTRKNTKEEPRIRFYLLCEKPVLPEQYDAVSRILAEKIDPSMDSVDDVSFRLAQMMFKPTVSRDQEYVFWHNPGVRVNPKKVLDTFRLDWRDYTNLPYSDARGQRRKTQDKAEDPTTKRGPVGAFCRAYSVEEAMAEFIPDVYLEGDTSGSKPRYSYSEGTTSNGVVVEDDGLFIYSHHGSDPCGETLVNAFDMVRIHRFDHLDEKKKDGSSPKDWPSYKALVELVSDNALVKAELLADRVDVDEMFDDISDDDEIAEELAADGDHDIDDEIADILKPATGAGLPDLSIHKKPPKPKKGWPQRELELDQNGMIKSTTPNIATIIGNDPRMWGSIGRNLFTNKIASRRSIKTKLKMVPEIVVEDRQNGEDWTDLHDVTIRAILEAESGQKKAGWGMKVARGDVQDAILLVGQRWRFHPVIEYYEGLTWDGTPRVERLFIDYLGTEDLPYFRDTARLFMIASVARVYNPGHKWDHAPILQGEQGIRKSSFIKFLFGKAWAGELTAHMASNKDAVEQMLGKQCLELPELANMRKSESEDVKAFMTFEEDRVRLSYDRRMSTFKRQCVFMGTTNAEEYLKDPTGNRRFWPIRVMVKLIDTFKLAANRDQLWAEAVHLWRQAALEAGDYRDIQLALKGEALLTALELQNEAREENSTEATAEQIKAWLDLEMPLSQFLSGDGALADLDDFDGEPIVRRTKTIPRQAAVEGLGIPSERMAQNKLLDANIGNAMLSVEGWKKTGQRVSINPYGRGRTYVREGASFSDIAQGYEVVGHTGDANDDEDIL